MNDLLSTNTTGTLNGVCSNTNGFFIGFAAASLVIIVVMLVVDYMRSYIPSPYGTKINWGAPYGVVLLMGHLSLWSLFPSVVFFVLFHIIIGDAIPMATNAACITIVGFPFIPAYLFLQGLFFWVVYAPDRYRAALGPLINKPPTDGDVLFLGATIRGLVIVDQLARNAESPKPAKIRCVDYSGGEFKQFADNNIQASGLASVTQNGEEIVFPAEVRGTNKFVLPFPSETFDRVVVSPSIRNTPPIGDWMTPEKIKMVRMRRILLEGLRVLKKGGELVMVDQVLGALLVEADLKDLGLLPTITDTGRKVSPLYIGEQPALEVRVKKEETISASENDGYSLNAETGEQTVSSPLLADNKPTVPHTKLLIILSTIEIVTFIVLCFVGAALYDPLNVPTRIPMSQRLGNCFVNIATSFPMMAYFARIVLLGRDEPYCSSLSFVRTVCVTTSLSLLAALLFTLLFWLPHFLLQLALSETSLDNSYRAMIGYGISITIGIFSFKKGKRASIVNAFKERNLDEKWLSAID